MYVDPNRVRQSVIAATCAVIVASAVKSAIDITLEEREKRRQIRRDMHLDVQAIKNAQPVLDKRIDDGEIRTLSQLRDAFQSEIAFQKIAIREDD